MAWKTVATGTSFDDLQQLVADQNLKPGDRIKVEMTSKFTAAFDLWGMEAALQQQLPPELKVIDVWADGNWWTPWADGKVYAELEVRGTPLFAILGWIAIAFAIAIGVVLLVSFIKIMMKVTSTIEGASSYLIWGLIIGGGALAAYFGYKYISSRRIEVGKVKVLESG